VVREAIDATSRLRRPHTSSSRAVGSFVPRLTRKAFEKYGFSCAALLTEWATIVGGEIAGYTQPERLKWARRVEAYGVVEHGEEGRPGATLVLRVDGPRAIELQYKSRQIIERINAYFGYRAVAEMRFVQAPIEGRRGLAALGSPSAIAAPGSPSPDVAAVTDHALRSALTRLQANVLAEPCRRANARTPRDWATSPQPDETTATAVQLSFSAELP
jgi:hypothetical protein